MTTLTKEQETIFKLYDEIIKLRKDFIAQQQSHLTLQDQVIAMGKNLNYLLAKEKFDD